MPRNQRGSQGGRRGSRGRGRGAGGLQFAPAGVLPDFELETRQSSKGFLCFLGMGMRKMTLLQVGPVHA